MSYNVDELFRFEETEGGYAVAEYLKKDNPTVTELEIPGEYNGLPVVSILDHAANGAKYIKRVRIPGNVCKIMDFAFYKCSSLEEVELSEGLETIEECAFAETGLKSVKLPKSLITLCGAAFHRCKDLERVEFNSAPIIGRNAFSRCPKLPPETVVMGLVCSFDITTPVNNYILWSITDSHFGECPECFRPDIFELLAKRNIFQKCNLEDLFKRMIDEKPELFPVAEQYGLLNDAELVDTLLGYAIEKQTVEITAYLLELKNRNFGFAGGDHFEL